MAAHNDEINRQAAEWATKGVDREWTAEEKADLDRWLAADIRHLGAYAKATAILTKVEQYSTAVSRSHLLQQPSTFALSRRQLFQGGMVAAAAVGLVVAAPYGWRYLRQQQYATGLGETRNIPLSDGSVIALNTNSKLVIAFTEARRDVTLVVGEALFDVAKDKSRPFVVSVDDVRVRAVGTSFAVRALPDRPRQVLVREGIVEIKREGAVTLPVPVRANEWAMIAANGLVTVTKFSPERLTQELAWKEGRISFDDQTLTAAAAEFQRYSDTRIVIADPDLGRHTVTGLYIANDPVGFAKAVAVSLNLRVVVRENEVMLTKKANGDG
ncbi:MAG: FecR domain-containing protein [Rhizomicrobium sp.]|nr:FecR domain-containing protein [Rhizomicrobium sp.]